MAVLRQARERDGRGVVVCVTGAPSSEAVVRAGVEFAAGLGARAFAVHFRRPAPVDSVSDDASVVPWLTLAEKLGAVAETVDAADLVEGILEYAELRGAGHIVIGRGRGVGLVKRLLRASESASVHVVPTPPGRRWPEVRPAVRTLRWTDPLLVVLSVGAATLFAQGVQPSMAEADLVLIYLVAVALASVWLHRAWAIVAAVLSVAAFNFFFVPPVGSFAVAHLRYLLTFAVMTVAGIVVSTTATRMRDRVRGERERGRRMSVLLDLTRGLTSASTLDQVAALAGRALAQLTDGEPELQIRLPGVPKEGEPSTDPPQGRVALLVHTAEGPAGRVLLHSGRWEEDPTVTQVIRAALALVGAAVERLSLDEQARLARLKAEVEQTRSDLLSAVSHDLRTPLGTIKGAATTLQQTWDQLAPPQRTSLLADIDQEADRLARMLANLLDISRLRGRDVALTGDWQAPEDLVGSALHTARGLLAGRDVTTRLPAEVSLVWVDALLVEQALVNLLENVARHAPKGPVEVDVHAGERGVTFRVADRGPGLGPGDPQRWFRRFERGGAAAGTGLGLAIVRAVVELHGGTVGATNRPGGGAQIEVFLPAGGPQDVAPPTWHEAEGGEP